MSKFSDYFLTPEELTRKLQTFTRRDLIGLEITWALGLLGAWFINFEAGIFIAFIFALYYWHIDSRKSFGLALACLLMVPVILFIAEFSGVVTEEMATAVATWGFYFLIIGMTKQIYEHFSRRKKRVKSNRNEGGEVAVRERVLERKETTVSGADFLEKNYYLHELDLAKREVETGVESMLAELPVAIREERSIEVARVEIPEVATQVTEEREVVVSVPVEKPKRPRARSVDGIMKAPKKPVEKEEASPKEKKKRSTKK